MIYLNVSIMQMNFQLLSNAKYILRLFKKFNVKIKDIPKM